jgi:hypothetical protein
MVEVRRFLRIIYGNSFKEKNIQQQAKLARNPFMLKTNTRILVHLDPPLFLLLALLRITFQPV